VTSALVIHCPACAAGYLLPRNLLGPLGARVTCPQCHGTFDVEGTGELVRQPSDEAPSREIAPPSGARADERRIASEVLAEFAARLGDELAAAARESRLFRDHGRELLEAFDHYLKRAGQHADAMAFREELRRRWHVDLFPPAGARGAAAAAGGEMPSPARPGRG
jgi:predicted Zn finger-like uncharacterized protein